MSNKLNLADPVQTSVSAENLTTSSIKDGELFTTNVSISLTNAPLEDGDQSITINRLVVFFVFFAKKEKGLLFRLF